MALPSGGGRPTPAAVARALLQHIESYYDKHAEDEVDPAVKLPPNRLLLGGAPREVAWDYDDGQLSVAYEQQTLGLNANRPAAPMRAPRGGPRQPGGLVRLVTLEVQLVRPAPAMDFYGRIPDRPEKDAHGYLLGVDLHHLSAAVFDAASSGALAREGVGEVDVTLGLCQTLGPQGQLAAVAQLLTVPLL